MLISEKVRELLCNKADLLRDSVRATDPGAREVLRKAMAQIDQEVDSFRNRQAEKEKIDRMVVERWTRKVG